MASLVLSLSVVFGELLIFKGTNIESVFKPAMKYLDFLTYLVD